MPPLARDDFYRLNADLISGDDSRVLSAQRELGVEPDGDPGPATWRALEARRPATEPRIVVPEKAKFFSVVKRTLFDGTLTQAQVSGMEDLFEAWGLYGTRDVRHLAYALGTDYHETGRRMQPVREGFATTDAGARAAVAKLHREGRIRRNYALPDPKTGQSHYGRGDVQLTHPENYDRMGAILNLPLRAKPDLALDPKVSKRILVEGLTRGVSNRGDFTGKAVEDYTTPRTANFVGMRAVVNGTDKAREIARYAETFLLALRAADALD